MQHKLYSMLNSSNLQKKIIAYFLLPEFRTRFPATQKIHKVLHAIHTLQILERINMTDNTVEKKHKMVERKIFLTFCIPIFVASSGLPCVSATNIKLIKNQYAMEFLPSANNQLVSAKLSQYVLGSSFF